MKTVATLMFGILVAGTAVAGPFDLSDVGGGAKWVFHFDWEAYKSTDMHLFLKTMPERDKLAAKMAAATEVIGFDPLEDIDSVTAYGDNLERKDGVMIIRGTFSPEKMIGTMQGSTAYTSEPYGAYTIHSANMQHHGRQKKGSCSFYDDGTLLLSKSPAALKSAIDVLSGNASSLKTSSNGIVVPELSKDVFAMAYAIKMEKGPSPKANILKNVEALTFAAAETDGTMGVEVEMEAMGADEAAMIQNALSGMISFGMLRASDDPALAEMLQAITVSSTGDDTVKVSLRKKSDELLAVLLERVEARVRTYKAKRERK